MQIVNLLAEPLLWNDPDVFSPIKGLKIHDQPIGNDAEEIKKSLKTNFGINDKLKAPLATDVNSVLNRANSELVKHFGTSTSKIFIAGIDNSEEFANKNLGGVSGYAWPNAVFLWLNPDREWKEMLFRTTLHEFNHCQRYLYNDPYSSFLDWLIFEGLAEDFESEVTGVHADYATQDKVAVPFIKEVEKFWDTMPPDSGDWFFGNEEKNVPFALGYRIGNYLVRKFRSKNPSMKWEEIIRLSSKDFLK